MNRRSNSMSHIPVRLFGFSNSSSKEPPTAPIRSRSATRVSQQIESNLLRPNRQSSLDKKASLTKQTPLSRQRSYIKDRTTPGSAVSSARGSRFSRVSPASGLKDRQSIQKLSSNKTWVHEQLIKVQNFLANSSLVDPTVVNPGNIKPPTIKCFIYLTTVLLKQIFHTVKISQENYKEEIVKKLKLMHYPGAMTNSTLKSVNTMHSWPQVIGMFGWLIDKIELKNQCTFEYPEEERHEYLLPELCAEYMLEEYNVYNQFQKPLDGDDQNNDMLNQKLEEVEQKYINKFIDILGFNPDDHAVIKATIDQNLELKKKFENDIEVLSQERENSQKLKNDLIDELNNLEAADDDEEAALDAELAHFNALAQKLMKSENELRSNLVKLEEEIKSQPFSYQQKNALLKEYEWIKNEVKIIKGRIQYAHNIKTEFDGKINEELEKLLTDWDTQKKNLLLARKDNPYEDQIKWLTEENECLKQKRDELEIEVKKFGKKSVAFFVDLYKQVDNNIKEMNNILINRKTQIEKALLKELEEREQLIKNLSKKK